MEKLKLHTPDFTQENIAKLAELFPNCITESTDEKGAIKRAIDFDQLRQELSNFIVEGPQERYQINWPGKREALLTANAPIAKTLRPCREESVDFDTTQNLFIEGDNLDALKLLQETYLNRVKVIYIDPPYNTGNDFIYKDDFSENSDTYLDLSNQKDKVGNRMVANTESNGRFHSNWLSMIMPRLKLARNLLSEDGVIFVSIGVEEFSNLKRVMDEIFGESNFIEIFSWVKTSTPPALSTKSRKTNEYILCYEKTRNSLKYDGELLDGGDQPLLNSGNSLRTLTFPKEAVRFSFLKTGKLSIGIPDRVELLDNINIVDGYSLTDFRLSGEFKWTQDFLDEEIKKGTTFIIKSEKLSIRFLRNDEGGYKRPTNFIKEKITSPVISKNESGVGTNESASSELLDLMDSEVFSYPKPVSLISYLINFVLGSEEIVLDFFAGSGTTAEAVIQWASNNNKKARFILVQLPEVCDDTSGAFKAGYKNIAEISKERIRLAGKKIKAENADTEGIDNLDIGFRVLKIDSSNMSDVYYSPDEVKQGDLLAQINNIREGRNEEDLLFQVLLDWGVDLSLPITREMIAGKNVFFVDGNALAACFEVGIDEKFVKLLAAKHPLRAVFFDAGFASDSVKINIEQIFKLVSPTTEIKTI